MFTIDALRESDIPAALRLSTQAGWNQLDADWRRLLTHWPQSCLAGRSDGKLIATATLATYGTALGWVGMVLVDETHRGQGHGGKIIDAALHCAAATGVKTVGLDATDLGRPVYLKRGFRDVAGIDRWVLNPEGGAEPRIAAAMPTSAEESVAHPADLADALAFDGVFSAVNRRDLLTCLCAETGVRWRVLRASNNVAALAIHRRGRLASHLGPIVAQTEDAAADVLDGLFAEFPGMRSQPILIDVPRGRLKKWLPDRGFVCSRRLTRMLLGSTDSNLMSPSIFAACGFELG